MKNLFCIDRTDDPHNNQPDRTPFHAECIDETLNRKLEEASAAAFDAFDQSGSTSTSGQAAKQGTWQLGLGLLLSVGAVVPMLVWRDSLFSGGTVYLAWILLGMLVAGGVLVRWAHCVQRNAMARENRERQDRNNSAEAAAAMENTMKELNRLQKQAHAQLHVPDTALEVDVFPFMYRRKGEKQVSLNKQGCFDNLLTLVWRQGKSLCLSNGVCNLRIPVDAIKGRVCYDRSFREDMWLRDERYNEGRFKPYHLKQAGMLAVRGRTWYGILLTAPNGDSYELLIPSYDLPQLEKLVTIPEIDTSAQSS